MNQAQAPQAVEMGQKNVELPTFLLQHGSELSSNQPCLQLVFVSFVVLNSVGSFFSFLQPWHVNAMGSSY